jgi:DNA polymerase III delta subunit
VKFYDFIDKQPKIGTLAIVEGTERVLAERTLDVLLDRLLPPDVRELNLRRYAAGEIDDMSRVRESVQAMPFLADRRVVVITDAQTLKAQQRRDLWDVAQSVPDGSTLVILDLLSPRSQRPQPFGALAGRSALRIDTTASEEVRARYVDEILERLGAAAEPRVKGELVRSEADLASVRNDLEKLALSGKKITFKEFEQESLSIEDPKAYRYAGALLEGKLAEALETAYDFFESDPRGAAIPLLSALATECGLVWELARTGGVLPARMRWRERALRPIASRIGERRARAAYERAVRGIESIVTGTAGSDPDDHRTLVDRVSAELSLLLRR